MQAMVGGALVTSSVPRPVNTSARIVATRIGKASTGRAISELSGIARKNAIEAWLGCGAKSAGGLGMSGGKNIISGLSRTSTISVGTALADMSLYFASVLLYTHNLFGR